MITGGEEASSILEKKESSGLIPPLADENVEAKKIENQNQKRKKKIVYEVGADALCEFGNGDTIRVNKSLISFYSTVFSDMFFGESPTTTVKIDDFDSESFRSFLDCLFGLKEYTVLDALLIYPIAYKYDVKESIESCSKSLHPYEMNENVCLTLNLATFYSDTDMYLDIISFVNYEVGIFQILVNDSYRNLLDPSAMSRIIEENSMDSYLWKMVYQWGESYLKKQRKSDKTVRLLFDENDILSQISLKDFESASSILDFHKFSNNEVLDPNEILNFLNEELIWNKNLPDRSLWVKVKKGDTVVDVIKLRSPFRALKHKASKGISIYGWSNTIYSKESISVKSSICYYKGDARGPAFDLIPVKTSMKHRAEFRFDIPIEEDLEELVISKVEITYNFLRDSVICKSLCVHDVSSELCFSYFVSYKVK